MTPALAIVAAAAGGDAGAPDLVAQALGYGVTGLVLALILGRVLVPYWVVTRQDAAHAAEIAAKDQTIAAQMAEIAALRTGVDASNAFVRDEVVPALTRTAEISREYVAALNRRAGAGTS
jgi:hypothetical protein